MKIWIGLIILLFSNTISSQTNNKAIKFIPQMSLKIGSQKPAIGGQFDLIAGLLLKEKYLVGIGGGYCTNMGMGGKTFPLYADARMYFASKKSILFARKDEDNNYCIASQIGININNNLPFKTGFIAAFDITYRFGFIKIKQYNFPPFYAGLGIEYSYSKIKDEYRGFIIQDGVLKHVMLNIKISFDISPIKLN
jgi:hypothetical protein